MHIVGGRLRDASSDPILQTLFAEPGSIFRGFGSEEASKWVARLFDAVLIDRGGL